MGLSRWLLYSLHLDGVKPSRRRKGNEKDRKEKRASISPFRQIKAILISPKAGVPRQKRSSRTWEDQSRKTQTTRMARAAFQGTARKPEERSPKRRGLID